MTARYANSRDGTRIAYDVSGAGPLVVLAHGLTSERHLWHAAGHVAALAPHSTVATLDLRGHGDSDKPTDPLAYGAERLLDDVHAVADALGSERFAYWGFSYGGTIGVQATAHAPRVTRTVIAVSMFGWQGEQEWLRQGIARIERVIGALEHGRLDTLSLADEDRAALARLSPYIVRACLKGIANFPGVEPAAALCPAFLYTSTRDHARPAIQAQRPALEAAGIRVAVYDGLTHSQLVTAREVVLPPVQAFLQETG
jgi:pimeloyl-ACP methyl ester carboxylesterase